MSENPKPIKKNKVRSIRFFKRHAPLLNIVMFIIIVFMTIFNIQLKNSLNHIDSRIDGLSSNVGSLSYSIDRLSNGISDIEDEIDTLRYSISDIESEVDELRWR